MVGDKRQSVPYPTLPVQVARLAACVAAVGVYVGLRSLLAVDQLVRIFRKVRGWGAPHTHLYLFAQVDAANKGDGGVAL